MLMSVLYLDKQICNINSLNLLYFVFLTLVEKIVVVQLCNEKICFILVINIHVHRLEIETGRHFKQKSLSSWIKNVTLSLSYCKYCIAVLL